MKVLYLGEGENLTLYDIEDLLDDFIQSGVNPEELKRLAYSLDKQGFHMGRGEFGNYTVICLNLPTHTITVQAKKMAYEGLSELSYPG